MQPKTATAQEVGLVEKLDDQEPAVLQQLRAAGADSSACLIWAVQKANEEAVAWLIRHKAYVNFHSKGSPTLLCAAKCEDKPHAGIIKLLLDAKAIDDPGDSVEADKKFIEEAAPGWTFTNGRLVRIDGGKIDTTEQTAVMALYIQKLLKDDGC